MNPKFHILNINLESQISKINPISQFLIISIESQILKINPESHCPSRKSQRFWALMPTPSLQSVKNNRPSPSQLTKGINNPNFAESARSFGQWDRQMWDSNFHAFQSHFEDNRDKNQDVQRYRLKSHLPVDLKIII